MAAGEDACEPLEELTKETTPSPSTASTATTRRRTALDVLRPALRRVAWSALSGRLLTSLALVLDERGGQMT